VLPRRSRFELLEGLLGADVIGFQSADWAQNLLVDSRELPGATVNLRARTIRWQGRIVRVGIYPISIDVAALRSDARNQEVEGARRHLEDLVGDRALLLRVDRAELSKNILRGFLAFERFLERWGSWRGKVVFFAQLNPSREDMPEYVEYMEQCFAAADRVNERFGTAGWPPITVSHTDDFPTAIAGDERYDALLVNPVFDGMNPVAKEGPTLNRRDGVLILSENAGAFPELGRHAVAVSPFDLEGTAEAIGRALEMPGARTGETVARASFGRSAEPPGRVGGTPARGPPALGDARRLGQRAKQLDQVRRTVHHDVGVVDQDLRRLDRSHGDLHRNQAFVPELVERGEGPDVGLVVAGVETGRQSAVADLAKDDVALPRRGPRHDLDHHLAGEEEQPTAERHALEPVGQDAPRVLGIGREPVVDGERQALVLHPRPFHALHRVFDGRCRLADGLDVGRPPLKPVQSEDGQPLDGKETADLLVLAPRHHGEQRHGTLHGLQGCDRAGDGPSEVGTVDDVRERPVEVQEHATRVGPVPEGGDAGVRQGLVEGPVTTSSPRTTVISTSGGNVEPAARMRAPG
jgi:Glycosyltransferase family 20